MFRKISGTLLGLALVALTGADAVAHEVHWEGQVRLRYEADDRSFLNNVDFSHGVYQRTRISVHAVNDQGAEVFVQLQDSRRWGDEGSASADTENVDLHQAFVRLTDPNIDGLEWFFGRQELEYGKGRVISKSDWDMNGNSFDAARARMTFADDTWLDLGVSKVSEADVNGVDENLVFGVLHLHFPDANANLEPILLYKENDGTDMYITAFGAHGNLHRGRVGLYSDAVYQNEDSRSQTAYLVNGTIAVDVSADENQMAGLAAGYSVYSGDDPSDPDDMAYDNLYYDYHKYHGAMDLAQDLAAAAGAFNGAGSAGLKDAFFKGWVKSESGFGVKGGLHFFSTDVDVPVTTGNRNTLGREVNVILFKDLESGMSAQFGAGFFSPGNVTEMVVGDESASWLYAQGTTHF